MDESNREDIEYDSYRDAENLFGELNRRLAEDDTNPNDTVSWETIRAEAQARWIT